MLFFYSDCLHYSVCPAVNPPAVGIDNLSTHHSTEKLLMYPLLWLKDSWSVEPCIIYILFLQLLAIRPSLALSVMTTSICSYINAALEGPSVPIAQTWSPHLLNGTVSCFLSKERHQHLSAGLRGLFKGPRAQDASSLHKLCFLPIITLQAFARQFNMFCSTVDHR